MAFPENFKWGAASAAYQIEGAADIDGKGPSVWDIKCQRPGAIFQSQSGRVACDHYHRFKEDVQIIKKLGIKNYRMSISWPRVLPEGIGEANPKGLDFYSRLFDELLKNDIEPFVTLFHWDYPQKLYEQGGWLNPQCTDWFAQYAELIAKHFYDRVKNWMTFNEPQCFIGLGHYKTEHAPGIELAFPEVLRAAHNVMLSHGKAVQAIRAITKQPASIGYAPVGLCSVPYDEDSENDIEAARQDTFSVKPYDCHNSILWMDPVLLGRYPQQCIEAYGPNLPSYTDEEMKIISQPIDFLGVNIYTARQVSLADGKVREIPRETGHWYTPMNWSVEPKSLYWGPRFFYERYQKPIYITENGMANHDAVSEDGGVHDPQRIEFFARYLKKLAQACSDGIDVSGYFLWTLMDNFEWAHGYSKRFGIVHTDFNTQKRTIKDSGYWYKKIIQTNGRALFKTDSVPGTSLKSWLSATPRRRQESYNLFF